MDTEQARRSMNCIAAAMPPRTAPLQPIRIAAVGAAGESHATLHRRGTPIVPGTLGRLGDPPPARLLGNTSTAHRTLTANAALGKPARLVALDGRGLVAGMANWQPHRLVAAEPQPEVELRVRAIYAVDEGAAAIWTLDQVRAVVAGLVETANRDLAGTGFRFVCYVRHDVEVRHDTVLRRDIPLADDVQAKFVAGTIGEAEGQKIIDEAALKAFAHRNAVAAERPASMLWLFSRGNGISKTTDAKGKFSGWSVTDNRWGSFSGGGNNFVALHEGFLNSVEGARSDASRAVHEVGHYLGLAHTHREPFHDLTKVLSAEALKGSAADRLAAWKQAIAAWLDQNLADNATAAAAREFYDADRVTGVLDTPPDPGAGILELANDAAGFGVHALGPVTTVSLAVHGVAGTVNMTPLRNNPMSYYLEETPDAMRFTPDQIRVMRTGLIEGNRRPLVAAQLGDSVTPDQRVCAVWSPNTAAQRLTWGYDLPAHQAEHDAMHAAGMVLTHQQAYTRNGAVRYDGIWDPGTQPQEVLWGWLDEHVKADVVTRASHGMQPVLVQGYQHLDQGIRYNVTYEPGTDGAHVLLGVTQEELGAAWKTFSPQGFRMTCISTHLDAAGTPRYSTVLRKRNTPQTWAIGWTLEDIAAEYDKRWSDGWRISHIAVAKLAAGHRWSAVFEPDVAGQLVYWAHVRERIAEVYDEMWAIDYKLRALCAVPA